MPVYSSLDLAKQTGVCWGEPNGKPEFETWHLGGTDVSRGKRGLVLMQKLADHIAYVKPDLVFIEAPLPAHVASNAGHIADTTIVLNGYVFMAETVCFSRKVPTRLIERQDALRHFTGQARFHRSLKDGAKKACMARATALRWVCENYDQADAGAMWHLGCALQDQKGYALAGVAAAVKFSRIKTKRKGTLL